MRLRQGVDGRQTLFESQRNVHIPARHREEPSPSSGADLAMNGPLEWIAAAGTIIAAALIAADLGRTITGYGFVLFCAVAIT